MRLLEDELRGATATDHQQALRVDWRPPPGQRVKLSEYGVWSLVAWPVRGRLRGLTRRGLYTRKITEHSVGTVTSSEARREYQGHLTVVVKWDECSEPRRYATCFLEAA